MWWGGGESVGVGVVEWRESVVGRRESVCCGKEGRVCVVGRRGECVLWRGGESVDVCVLWGGEKSVGM